MIKKSFKEMMHYLCIVTVIASMLVSISEANAKSFTFNESDFDINSKQNGPSTYSTNGFMYDAAGQYFRLTDTVYYQGAKII